MTHCTTKTYENKCDQCQTAHSKRMEAAFDADREAILADMKAEFAERMAPHFAEFDRKLDEIGARA